MSGSSPGGFRAALIQLRAGRKAEPNIVAAEQLIRKAAAAGAAYVQTPENTGLMELEPALTLAQATGEPASAALAHFRALAEQLGIWLHLGSLAIKIAPDKLANRSFLIAPSGEIAARYDKLHMFDVDLANGEVYRESASYEPGGKAVLADLPWGKLGLTICYDLRFPGLYRALAEAGASFIAIPAAFTKLTGQAHWHVLARARAIETGCFIFAATQGGLHENGRATYGHSLIVSPWGEVLAEGGEAPQVLLADIDPELCNKARRSVPSLRHGREFEIQTAGKTPAMAAS